jgi:predicted alpha-1,6-mannanase (GH76 family)
VTILAVAVGFIRRLRSGIRSSTISATALIVVATGVAGLTASAEVRADNPVTAAMAELMTSYNPATGLIGDSWWQSAVALSTVETYAQTTGDTGFDAVIARAFAANSTGKFENGADDDTAWWGLAWLQAYQLTHVRSYLAMAEADADYIHEDWDKTCGGGVWWLRNPESYKNAIANELFLELTAWLHNTIRADKKYLAWAEAEWSWFDHSGMINKDDLVNDGLDSNCRNNGQNTWTYNQGVILAALAQLYKATGNRQLLAEAERIADAAISHLTVGGVLTERCRTARCAGGLDSNTQSFKGIFVQDLKVLAETAKTTRFDAFISRQAQSIAAHDTGGDDQLGMSWTGPAGQNSTSFTQASALDALVAAVRLP